LSFSRRRLVHAYSNINWRQNHSREKKDGEISTPPPIIIIMKKKGRPSHQIQTAGGGIRLQIRIHQIVEGLAS
jgi:hypothetical protein